MKIEVLNAAATSRKICEARKERKITVAQITESLNLCSEQAVYKWQRGDSMPTLDNLVSLCGILGMSLDEVVQTDEITME